MRAGQVSRREVQLDALMMTIGRSQWPHGSEKGKQIAVALGGH